MLMFALSARFLCTFFLEKYYIGQKKNELIKTLPKVQEMLKRGEESSENIFTLERASNISIIITDNEHKPQYNVGIITSIVDDRAEIRNGGKVFASVALPSFDRYFNEYEGKPVFVKTALPFIENERSFLSLVSEITLADGSSGFAILQTSVFAINENAAVAADFVGYVSLAIFLLGLPVIFFISRGISRPIIKISETAQKISSLDFSEKLKISSRDEIGGLSENINEMSETLEQTINQLRENLKTKERIEVFRKEFIANVSHELKTPISLVGGYAEGLKLNVDGDEKDYYCDVIIDESAKMNKLVLELLELSQIEYGSVALERESFDLSSLVTTLAEKYRISFEKKNITLETNTYPDVFVFADPDKIERALTNYIINALHHAPENGKVSVVVKQCEEKAVVRVYNDGAHIEHEHKERIWHSFYKADAARTREYGGQGLGLSIVRAVVEAHGGNYGVENVDGGGEFFIEL